jgi:hypothetical protein
MAALNAPPFARDNPKREVDQQQGEDAQQQPFLTPTQPGKNTQSPAEEHDLSRSTQPPRKKTTSSTLQYIKEEKFAQLQGKCPD